MLKKLTLTLTVLLCIAGSIQSAPLPAPQLAERYEISQLAAFTYVLNDWQDSNYTGRGYNIGCVMLSGQCDTDRVVWADKNSVNVMRNSTQHGEVRCMQNYTNYWDTKVSPPPKTNKPYFGDATIFTTLEPCAQCSGMMTMLRIRNTVYGQTDPNFGKALERLALNSTALGAPPAGYPPYPWTVTSTLSPSIYAQQLDQGYTDYVNSKPSSTAITAYLTTPQAKAIFQNASKDFNSYNVKYPENQQFYDDAVNIVNNGDPSAIVLSAAPDTDSY
ncbi:MAG: nucleoside deaminase [Lentisphaerota bacterium]